MKAILSVSILLASITSSHVLAADTSKALPTQKHRLIVMQLNYSTDLKAFQVWFKDHAAILLAPKDSPVLACLKASLAKQKAAQIVSEVGTRLILECKP